MSATQLKAAATGAATPQEARNPYDALKRQLEQSKGEFLPLFGQSQQNVDRFVRVVLNAVLANPELIDANRRSLIAACMKAAQDGLMPDGREAVLNIYNSKVSKRGEADRWEKQAQYLPMVGGLVKKLYESGEITSLDAACVYEGDRFVFRRGDDPKLEHEPTMADTPGKVTCAYVVAKLKSGEVKREVMPRRDIEQVRAASKAGSGPWGTWYDQMAIKSVIKRAYKQLPKIDAFEKIADSDNQAMGFAATPESVGDIVGRGPASAPAALAHSEPVTFEMDLGSRGDAEPVARESDTGAAQATSSASSAETKPQATAAARTDAAPMTYAQFADRLMKTKDKEIAALVMDEARDLPDDQYTELTVVYRRQFPEKSNG